MKTILFFIIFVLTLTYKSEGNIWFQTYSLNQTLASLNFVTRGRYGFTYVEVFSQNLQNFSLIFYTQNNKVKIIQIPSFKLDQPIYEGNKTVNLLTPENIKTFGNAFNEIEITVAIPLSYLFDNSTLKIGYNQYQKPVIGKTLGNLEQTMTELITNMTFTPTFIFKFNPRLEFLHYYTSIPYHLVLITSFILLIFLHKHQPLKSKGYIPFITW